MARFKEDSQLLPEEKETFFHISGEDQSKVYVTSNMANFMEHLHSCEEFKKKRSYTDEQGNIIHLEGELPVTYLTFRSKPKTRNYLSRVIS